MEMSKREEEGERINVGIKTISNVIINSLTDKDFGSWIVHSDTLENRSSIISHLNTLIVGAPGYQHFVLMTSQ